MTVSAEVAERTDAVHNDRLVHKFVDQFLRVDGVFLLRLIAHNTSGITTTEITKEMWDVWYEREVQPTKSIDTIDE